MVRRALVRPGSSAGDRGETHSDVSTVPAAPAAGNLLDRPGYGKVDEREGQQLISDRPSEHKTGGKTRAAPLTTASRV